jgi:hypothetical protein
MIGQQAIGKCISDRLNMFGIQLQKVAIVPLFFKKVLPVVTPVVDVVVGIIGERCWIGQGCSP